MDQKVSEEKTVFKFKNFEIKQELSKMKIGTDGILMGALAKVESKQNILDIGTGTGLIALMLAQRAQTANITAVEVDSDSADEAKTNFENSPWASNLEVQKQTIQDFSKSTDQKFDLIVTNPPFFTGGALSDNQDRNSVRHTQKLSHSDLARSVQNLLAVDGTFSLILPFMEGLRFTEMASSYGLNLAGKISIKSFEDGKVVRLFQSYKHANQISPIESKLTLYEKGSKNRSKAFHELTKDFYL